MKRIKYISQFAAEMSDAEIDHLAEISAKNNLREGITGVLLSTGEFFFQIVEGPDEAIDRLMKKITVDRRHKKVLIMNSESGELGRLFPDWSMKRVRLIRGTWGESDALKVIMETLLLQQQLVGKLTRTLERTIWQQLSKTEKMTSFEATSEHSEIRG